MQMVFEWLQRDSVRQWLDYGNGRQSLSEAQMSFMLRNPANYVRLYCDPASGKPVGLAALSGVKNLFGVTSLWGVRGNFRAGGRYISESAARGMLNVAFLELNMRSVTAWALACNLPSIALLRRAGFREFGRQRACHPINGQMQDRLHFEVVAQDYFAEHRAAVPNSEETTA